MLVHVDEAGSHRSALSVDDVSSGGLEGPSDLFDLVAFNENVGVLGDRVAGAIPDSDIGDQDLSLFCVLSLRAPRGQEKPQGHKGQLQVQ